MERLYIVTRADLPPGAQIAQSCHALRAFVDHYPELDAAWHAAGGNLVCLSVADEGALDALHEAASAGGLAVSGFWEQDMGDTLTGLAIESRAKKLVRPLKLALRAA